MLHSIKPLVPGLLLCGACVASQAATTIDIDARDPSGTELSLDAGSYSFSYVGIRDGGAYDAWSAWAPGADCGGGPGSCPTGFINELRIEGLGPDPTFVGDSFTAIWPTAAEALAAAQAQHSPFVLTLTAATTLRFLVGESPTFAETGIDGPSWQDNVGGLSLTVTAVPEPSAYLMLAFGLAGLIAFTRTRR